MYFKAKKVVSAIFIIMLAGLFFSSCAIKKPITNIDNNKLNIVTTIFPPYDFTRQICADYADITMLLRPGCEAHNYEPTPKDIIKIQTCDIFIYNGGESDEWVEKILSSFDSSKIKLVKMTDAVTLYEEQQTGAHNTHTHKHEHEHKTEWDEHVWTSPVNAIKICNLICDTLCNIDTDNSTVYKTNTQQYTEKLKQLDEEFKNTVKGAKSNTLIFADRFPARYFTEQYNLKFFAAFPGCADQTEPSSATLAYITDKVKLQKVKYVFYIEFSNQKIADVVCEQTGAKKLMFNSCHNVTAQQFKNGITYLDLMRQNLKNVTEAIN